MRKPTIHLNGTGKKMLFEGYLNAAQACSKAIDAIQALEFNARDYYPQGGHAWREACSEMEQRLVKLKSVQEDMLAIAMHAQNDGRDE